MRIKEIVIARVILPFASEFSHSLRKRFWVRNIVVILIDENGKILGAGEGAPRSYVTGENTEVAEKSIRYLINRAEFPIELENVGQIWHMIDSFPGGKEMNSAICALEMALLDACARFEKKKLIDFFNMDHFTDSIEYGAAIPLDSEEVAEDVCRTIKSLGINKLKLKIGTDYEHNRMLLDVVKRIFPEGYDLRVDVNGAWTYETGLRHLELMHDYRIKIIEQPMPPGDLDIVRLSNAAKRYNISFMADESVCSLEDLYALNEDGDYQVINIRLSKCGGLRRSLAMIDYIRKVNMKFQIGCQLGESGLLSSAGRVLGLLSDDSVYYEGSYDKLLLAENLTDRDVSFSHGGRAGILEGTGLGVMVNMDRLKKMSEHFSVIGLP